MAYDTQAQEFVYGFYARGWSKERALPEIRKVYVGFAGSTWDEWVKKYDWPQRRALADVRLRELDELCLNATQVLVPELDEIRRKLAGEIRAGKIDTQTVYAYASVAKQIAELSRQYLTGRDPQKVSTEVLGQAFEKLLTGLSEMNGLADPLKKHATEIGRLITDISAEFGREARV